MENIHVEESGVIGIQSRYSQWANKFVGGEKLDEPVKPAARKMPAVKVSAPANSATANVEHKVVAPLPGTVTEVKVKVGDKVAAGQTVVILEAMKMANNLDTEQAGTVKEICCNTGESVKEGTVLVVVE